MMTSMHERGWGAVVAAMGLATGCILEDNPAFIGGEATETAGTVSDGTAGSTTDGPTGGTATTGVSETATDATGDETGDTGGPTYPDVGCSDPDECTVIHIGPAEGLCPHDEADPANTTCDFVGTYALRIAAGTAEAQGGFALIVMHPDVDEPAQFLGGVEIPGDTTVTAAPGVPRDMVEVYFGGEVDGTLRLIGDDVHLHDFTIVERAGAEHAFVTRLVVDEPGTETGGHLLENLSIASIRAEVVGTNSIVAPFDAVGPDTTVINNHFWGYFESQWRLQFATGSVFAHNTIIAYEDIGTEALFDARGADGIEISNNVIASLTQDEPVLVAVDDLSGSVTVVGNALEGFDSVFGAVATPGLIDADNTLGPLPAQSPHEPLLLADAPLTASPMGASIGRSLDGVALEGASDLLPGAFQVRSPVAGPRPSVVRVGDGSCGGERCDFERSDANEIQHAIWRTWPGGTVEIYPSDQPYAGPGIVSWPMTVRGMGSQPDDVTLRRVGEDPFLVRGDVWGGGSPAVVRVNRSLGAPSLVEMLTLEAGTGQIGLTHEGLGSAAPAGRHELRRLILRDDGTTAGAPATFAMYLGSEVVAHDILIHGDYATCVRFGPRSYEGSVTPATTTYVHHLTCRLTEPLADGTQSVFDVASVDGTIMADIVAELSDGGAVFRAQRRTSSDAGALAANPPTAFTAHSLMVRGHAVVYDDFDPLLAAIDVTALSAILVGDPMFVSVADSHLAPGAVGIDGGVNPTTLDGGLSLGTALDGVSRAGQPVDRGCYEQ
jgi:hypothetical protein